MKNVWILNNISFFNFSIVILQQIFPKPFFVIATIFIPSRYNTIAFVLVFLSSPNMVTKEKTHPSEGANLSIETGKAGNLSYKQNIDQLKQRDGNYLLHLLIILDLAV